MAWPLTPKIGPKVLEIVECGDFLFSFFNDFLIAHKNLDAMAASIYGVHGLKSSRSRVTLCVKKR